MDGGESGRRHLAALKGGSVVNRLKHRWARRRILKERSSIRQAYTKEFADALAKGATADDAREYLSQEYDFGERDDMLAFELAVLDTTYWLGELDRLNLPPLVPPWRKPDHLFQVDPAGSLETALNSTGLHHVVSQVRDELAARASTQQRWLPLASVGLALASVGLAFYAVAYSS